jgi:hypothetical protein
MRLIGKFNVALELEGVAIRNAGLEAQRLQWVPRPQYSSLCLPE